MSQQVHPDRDRLTAFVTGKLDQDPSLAVEAHVQGCAVCAEALEALPASDTLVMLLRSAETMSGATPSGSDADVPTVPPDLRQWSLPPGPSPAPRANPTVPAPLASHARYKVLELLGAGGMGAVYKAEHMRMQRLVALKTISPELVKNPDAVERFNREIRAAAKLSHPNIVTAHDADQAGDLHFLVMELAEGETLARHVARHGPMPIPEACDAIRQAALGLQHAHERGMVHRDIKPQNLMLAGIRSQESGIRSQESGIRSQEPGVRTRNSTMSSLTPDSCPLTPVVKILDFGLARFVQEVSSEGRTELGAVMGTPDYMAPEQALDTRQADIRADIYSLGCTLYFLLTGQPPFAGVTTMETLLRHQSVSPRRLRELRPDAPRELESILTKLLAKRPEERYQTPAQVADALAPWCKRPNPLPAPAPPRQHRPWRIAAALGAVAALVCGIVIVIETQKGRTTIDLPDKNAKVSVNGQQVYPKPDKPVEQVPVRVPQDVTAVVLAGSGKGAWTLQDSGVKDVLHGVAFVDAKTGVAVGENNTILRTTDAGKTWARVIERRDAGRPTDLRRILFNNAKEGWIITSIVDTILHSKDAGATWTPVALPQPQGGNSLRGSYHGAQAVAGSRYFYLCWGGAYLFQTDDGGRTWQELNRKIPIASLTGASLSIPDGKNGVYVNRTGGPTPASVGTTSDGGATWAVQKLTNDQANNRGNSILVQMVDARRGWFVPYGGTIHVTDDGGKTWTPQPLGHAKNDGLIALHFLDTQQGHVLCSAYPGEVRRTTDGGKTWRSLGKLRNPSHLHGMSFPSMQAGWVVGEKGYIEHYSEDPPKSDPEATVEPFASTTLGAIQVKGETGDYFFLFKNGKQVDMNQLLNTTVSVSPGTYEVDVNYTKRTVQVEAGKKTILVTGTLLVEGGKDGLWTPYQGKDRKLRGNNPRVNEPLAFFPGTYRVDVHPGQPLPVYTLTQNAQVTAGRTTVLKE